MRDRQTFIPGIATRYVSPVTVLYKEGRGPVANNNQHTITQDHVSIVILSCILHIFVPSYARYLQRA